MERHAAQPSSLRGENHYGSGVRLAFKARWFAGAALAVAAAVAISTGASAAGGIDLAGTWQCCGPGGASPQTWVITSGTGSLKGKGVLPDGTKFATITGTLKGNKVKIVTTYTALSPGYVGTAIGTVSSGGNTMSGTWTSNIGQSGTWSATRAAAPPVLGKSVDAAPVSGVVLVKLPGQKKFTRLTAGDQIPLGSLVDASHGVVRLTAAKDRHGHTTNGRFYAGELRVGQQRVAAAELTVLTLAGPKPSGCSARLAATARRRRHRKRSLWGSSSKGNFRTVGSYASATERGTKWLTQDTCSGTLIHVTQGAVAVADFPHHRTLLVHAPHSFLAHPGAGG
jgi:hypothetical protein